MSNQKIMFRCFFPFCGNQSFQMGHGLYDGKYIRRYDISVCMSCWRGNWDGWAPHYEKLLIAHLKEKGLPIPERNEKGWLPRE